MRGRRPLSKGWDSKGFQKDENSHGRVRTSRAYLRRKTPTDLTPFITKQVVRAKVYNRERRVKEVDE